VKCSVEVGRHRLRPVVTPHSRTAWYWKIQTAKSEASETVYPFRARCSLCSRTIRSPGSPTRRAPFVTRNGRPPSSNKVVEYHLDDPRRAGDLRRSSRISPPHTSHCLTPAQRPKLFSVNCDTPMLDYLEIYGHVVETRTRSGQKVASLGRHWTQPTTVN